MPNNPIPLDQRPGLQVRHGSPVTQSLSRLAKEHRLTGAVLITFHGDEVSTTSCGEGAFADWMERLADAILTRIDDGEFDPERLRPDGEGTHG